MMFVMAFFFYDYRENSKQHVTVVIFFPHREYKEGSDGFSFSRRGNVKAFSAGRVLTRNFS